MKIISVEWKNFNSYGNVVQRIDFDSDKGDLFLLLGGNGHGKCLSPDTEIEVEIENEELREKFLEFLSKKSLPLP
jgi:ABC-type microcin C transport system duplicated ATPase subunit YejF